MLRAPCRVTERHASAGRSHGDYIRPFSMPFQYMRGRP